MTRYNNGIYDREDADKWMKDRFNLFKKTRESVLSQEGDFKWVISFDERTPANVINKICTDERIIVTHRDVRDYFEGKRVDSEYIITSRIDNDDVYLPGFVKEVQSHFQPQVYVIDIDYYQHETRSDKYYTSERFGPNSPFLSLVEPTDYIRTCYCRPHSVLLSGYPSIDGTLVKIAAKKINKILAHMVIHSDNMMNKIVGREVK
jgi:hypothetical protein